MLTVPNHHIFLNVFGNGFYEEVFPDLPGTAVRQASLSFPGSLLLKAEVTVAFFLSSGALPDHHADYLHGR